MTKVLVTVDTELSSSLHAQGAPVADNLNRSIFGMAGGQEYGIRWQMNCLSQYRLKGVFFVDPMPMLVYGQDVIRRIVEPILEQGHEVQLHTHTEWLQWANSSPVNGKQGRNIGDFPLADQVTLLEHARDFLMAAGAPAPNAFRAGNFGANDDTLTALAKTGFEWDASFNAAYSGAPCRISLGPDQTDPVAINGVTEMPVGGIFDWPGHFRPAQVCAMSSWEMSAALDHAAAHELPFFCIVTHSFEMLSRDRMRPNRTMMARFRNMCETISRNKEIETVGFSRLDSKCEGRARGDGHRLPPNKIRTLARVAAQALATLRYERLA